MTGRRQLLVHQPFFETVTRLPDKVALVCDGQRHTYGELAARVGQLAGLLKEAGIGRGDRVALFLDNSVEFITGLLAVSSIGAVFMPVNGLTKQEKLAYMLNDARAAALITHAVLQAAWAGALAANTSVRACLVVDGGVDVARIEPRCLAYPPARPAPAAFVFRQVDSVPTSETDLASIIYTSGSTGDPKGVMLSHLNMMSALRSVLAYLPVREDDIIMCVLPLAFGYGLYHWLLAAKSGATLVLESSFAFPLKVVQVMAAERATVFPGVPTIYTQLLNIKGLDKFDLSALRILTNAAAAISEEHIRRLRRTFPQADFYSMYGLTECKRVTFLPPDQLDKRPGSVGRGMPYQDHWLADESGEPLANGCTGELVVRGPHVMRGYWEKPDQTAERLRPAPASTGYAGELVLHTGDLFRTDAEGWLYFVARKDDIVKTRGEKVSPREVENAIYALDTVLEVAVIGTPDEHLGAAIKAFIVRQPGAELGERDVIRHCLSRLESFMVPKYVEFVTELPKTDTGKIKKTSLR
ncbi:MAG: class I adenylate-forming enzyme family protein [Betaproteobacteria bacterium]